MNSVQVWVTIAGSYFVVIAIRCLTQILDWKLGIRKEKGNA